MEDPLPLYFIVFFLFLILSAFFSASETAFFSINNIILKQLSEEKTGKTKRVIQLLSQPRRLLIAILIGNTLVNVSAASLAAILTTKLCMQAGYDQKIAFIINIVVVTFLILVFSEITPKTIAVKNARSFATQFSFMIFVIYYFFFPLTYVFDKSITLFMRLIKIKESKEERFFHSNEFQALLDMGEEQGELEEEEKEMIHSIFEFGDTIVREIMVPRPDVVCIAHDSSFNELIKLIKTKGHTRIPVFEDTIDKIKGIINAKDLLPFISNSEINVDLLELARPAIFVPEGKKIDELLRLFQQERQHMAIIVDEYGGTSGIVTLEDVIEEIVGEIRDEYDQEQILFKKIDNHNFMVNAKIDIESIDELININIPEKDDYDTLGGFILELIGSVPEEKQVLHYNDYDLKIEKVENNRIIQVRITYNPQPSENEKINSAK
ncbi:HlyC/CorC family transporter [candidate division KSB1 bacterium]|nr:HlyC/CorC family transporter [candidate division KSB1 bacterium]